MGGGEEDGETSLIMAIAGRNFLYSSRKTDAKCAETKTLLVTPELTPLVAVLQCLCNPRHECLRLQSDSLQVCELRFYPV